MKLSASTVSRLLNRAELEQILRIVVEPPRRTSLEEELLAALKPEGVQRVIVMPDGPGRNVENLGFGGAAVVMETLLALIATKPWHDSISLVFSCGTTVLGVMEELAALLYDYCVRERNTIRHTINIYPSTLVSDFELDAVYPHTAVTIFSNLLRSIPQDRLKLRAVAPHLPKDFYNKYTTDDKVRHAILDEYGLEAVMNAARQADIFVLGAGTAADPSYQKVHQTLHVRVGPIASAPEHTPEILYTPINTDGTEDKATESKIVGVTISECRSIKEIPGRYVIVVSGGREKQIALQSAFRRPCFNIIVTDADAVEEIMRGAKKI